MDGACTVAELRTAGCDGQEVHPEEQCGPEEEGVLEIVYQAVAERQVVENGQVPEKERAVEERNPSGSGRDSLGQGRPTRRSGGATIIRSTC